MPSVIAQFEQAQQKSRTPHVRSGDTVRVHQRIVEGNKVRTQGFEGVVIRTKQMNSLMASITVRRISSGVGVEKTFKLHAPNVEKVEILRRSKVRRNYLSFLRQRQGKSARLQEISFDPSASEVSETEAGVSVVEEAEEEAPVTPVEERQQAKEDPQEGTHEETDEETTKEESAPANNDEVDVGDTGTDAGNNNDTPDDSPGADDTEKDSQSNNSESDDKEADS
ncbi:50S ribosomal protein L19 [Candidatus Saccharibacteria bacterium QS_5_54_17]|nr:MAG: 50S ribosomal protein L19 [Candidatus Saccharibacteria bacterium QS_5_54_17]